MEYGLHTSLKIRNKLTTVSIILCIFEKLSIKIRSIQVKYNPP